MENKEQISQERTQLLNNFRNSLDAIVQKASQDKTPITEEEPQLEKFCSTLEGILQFGFKHGKSPEYIENIIKKKKNIYTI